MLHKNGECLSPNWSVLKGSELDQHKFSFPKGRKIKFAFVTALELTGITLFIARKFLCLISNYANIYWAPILCLEPGLVLRKPGRKLEGVVSALQRPRVWWGGMSLLSGVEIVRYCEPQTTKDMAKGVEDLVAWRYKQYSGIHNISNFHFKLTHSRHCPIAEQRFARISSRNFNFMRTGILLALFSPVFCVQWNAWGVVDVWQIFAKWEN